MATATAKKLMTAEEFAAWVERPENAGRWWELERGRIVEVPPPKSPHGTLTSFIAHLLWMFATARGCGRIESNDSGLIVEENPDTVRGVDVQFFDEVVPFEEIEYEYNRLPPALAVEVWSPTDRPNAMHQRVAQYLAMGVSIVWLVDPVDRTVGVHRKGQPPLLLSDGDELSGYDVLPDLKMRVSTLFALPGKGKRAKNETP